MTRIVSGYLFLESEDAERCAQCATIAELRPYGPNGSNICVKCGKKDPQMPQRMKKCLDAQLAQAPNGVIYIDSNQRN